MRLYQVTNSSEGRVASLSGLLLGHLETLDRGFRRASLHQESSFGDCGPPDVIDRPWARILVDTRAKLTKDALDVFELIQCQIDPRKAVERSEL